MQEYTVTITELLQRRVPVKANSLEEAQYKVETDYYSEKYILDADDFVRTTFKTKKRNLTQG